MLKIYTGSGTQIFAAVFTASTLFAAGIAAAQEDLRITPDLIAAAEREGSLTLQYSSPLVTMQGIAEEFNKTYPNIRVDLERKAGSAGAYSLLQELQAGVHRIDLFQGSDWGANQALIDVNAFAEVKPENQDDFQDAALVMAPQLFYPSLNTYVISYNPELVTEEEAEKLKSWKGVLDPVFKGRLSIVEPVFGVTLAPLTYVMNTEGLGEDYLRQLRDQEPLVFLSTAPARDAVISGQAPISWGAQWEAVTLTNIGDGAPVRFIYPEPTIEWGGTGWGVLDRAPNPNAARLFLAWKLSEEGGMVEQATFSNTRSTLATLEDTRELMSQVEATDWFQAKESVWNPSPEVMIEESATYQEIWVEIFRRGG
ncbi:MAG: extracellular solute-binding protein [Salinarimonadaceae bacterium]|nr:MAG: extracellular solute-binding protein [Salinarimonadaceae bacterium]